MFESDTSYHPAVVRFVPYFPEVRAGTRGPGSSVGIATDYGRGPDSSVGIATDYWLDGPGSNPGGGEIFRPSRPALGPT